MSRFVSAEADKDSSEHDDAWAAAQKVLDANKQAKQEAGRQEGGKTLYETLQANKGFCPSTFHVCLSLAAKQEAFEESIRLKNQFRTLDDDEADFLQSVLAADRAKEAEAKKADTEQLEVFRAQREAAEKALKQSPPDDEARPHETWTAGSRKRKKQDLLGGLKKRQQTLETKVAVAESTTVAAASPGAAGDSNGRATGERSTATDAVTPKPGLGLADYSSDDE